MRRDMDVIREVLLEVESYSGNRFLAYNGRDDEVKAYHAMLLKEEGYIKGSGALGGTVLARRSTWEGHELLDNIRDDGVWSSVKQKLGDVSGSASLEIVKTIAAIAVKDTLTKLPS